MRQTSRCLLAAVVTAWAVTFAQPQGPAEASDVPTLPELPLPTDGERLVIQSSARVELLQVATALTQQGAINLNSPIRTAAFQNVGRLATHPAIEALRALDAAGLKSQAWLAFILAHGEPPRLTPRRPVERWLPVWGEELTDRERQRLLQDAGGELSDFYEAADMGDLFRRHGGDYERIRAAVAAALPQDAPMADLDLRLGSAGEAVVLIPSPLATRNAYATLDPADGAWQTQVAVMALPDGDLPSSGVRQAAMRYEAIAGARLHGLFQAFDGEVKQVSRVLNEARRVLHSSGISLDLSGTDVIGPREVEASIIRALFLRSLEGNPAWLSTARADARKDQLPGVEALERELARLDADPVRFPLLYTQMAFLLDTALADSNVAPLTEVPNGDLDQWEGGVPVSWSIVAPTAPSGAVVPSQIARVAVDPRRPGGDSALRITADAQTNQWREALSDAILVEPGDRVTLVGRVKATGITRGTGQVVGANLFLVLRGPGGAQVSRVAGRSIVGTADWQETPVEIEIPAGAATLQIGVALGMTGAADFNDLRLTIERPPIASFLHHGGFEVASSDGAHGWERFLVLQSSVDGPSNESNPRVDGVQSRQGRASLLLTGDIQTYRWNGVRSSPIASRPGRRVTLTAWTRADNVRREGVQSRNANLSMEFLNERGTVIGTWTSPVNEGTSPWQQVQIEAIAPLDTVWVRVSCMLTMSGALWFDDLHLHQR